MPTASSFIGDVTKLAWHKAETGKFASTWTLVEGNTGIHVGRVTQLTGTSQTIVTTDRASTWSSLQEAMDDVETNLLGMTLRDAKVKAMMPKTVELLESELESLKGLHRMQLAAISVVSGCNTRTSLDRETTNNPSSHIYWTPAYSHVADAIKREIEQRERAEAAEARISIELSATNSKPARVPCATACGLAKCACGTSAATVPQSCACGLTPSTCERAVCQATGHREA